jgi:predicted secreted acid phosphatase
MSARAKLAAINYYKSGAYERDVAAVATQGGNWVKVRGAHVKKPAIVFDIDDTVLSNWTVISAK